MTQIGIKLDGMNVLLSKLQALGLAADDVIEETIFDMATDTQAEAIKGIQGPPKSGKTYQKYAPRRTHTASAPGQYPASDTGRLASSVVALPVGPMAYVVGTNVQYGSMLEFGTSRMAARPWLLPSFEKARIGLEKEMKIRLEAKT